MPASYTIISSEQYVHVTISGDATFNEIISLLEKITGDPAYDPRFHFLFDVRTITQYLSYAETLALFEFYKNNLSRKIRGKIAVVITHRVQFGITRIAATIFSIKGIDVNSFYSIEEAIRWFGTPAGR
jgi:hypothetical protein